MRRRLRRPTTSRLPDPWRVAVVGPESSGKTTLVTALAGWLHSLGVPATVVAEQGRILAGRLPPGHPWSYREQVATSRMHRGAEAAANVVMRASQEPGVLLLDGTAMTPLVWHMCAMAARPGYDAGSSEVTEELLAAAQSDTYDRVLLLSPDLPWQADGVRDDPGGRRRAFAHYRSLLPQADIIEGADREQQAQGCVSALLRKGSGPR